MRHLCDESSPVSRNAAHPHITYIGPDAGNTPQATHTHTCGYCVHRKSHLYVTRLVPALRNPLSGNQVIFNIQPRNLTKRHGAPHATERLLGAEPAVHGGDALAHGAARRRASRNP